MRKIKIFSLSSGIITKGLTEKSSIKISANGLTEYTFNEVNNQALDYNDERQFDILFS